MANNKLLRIAALAVVPASCCLVGSTLAAEPQYVPPPHRTAKPAQTKTAKPGSSFFAGQGRPDWLNESDWKSNPGPRGYASPNQGIAGSTMLGRSSSDQGPSGIALPIDGIVRADRNAPDDADDERETLDLAPGITGEPPPR